jgi:hypothetical protein
MLLDVGVLNPASFGGRIAVEAEITSTAGAGDRRFGGPILGFSAGTPAVPVHAIIGMGQWTPASTWYHVRDFRYASSSLANDGTTTPSGQTYGYLGLRVAIETSPSQVIRWLYRLPGSSTWTQWRVRTWSDVATVTGHVGLVHWQVGPSAEPSLPNTPSVVRSLAIEVGAPFPSVQKRGGLVGMVGGRI